MLTANERMRDAKRLILDFLPFLNGNSLIYTASPKNVWEFKLNAYGELSIATIQE